MFMKSNKMLLLFYASIIVLSCNYKGKVLSEEIEEVTEKNAKLKQQNKFIDYDMEYAIQKIESLAIATQIDSNVNIFAAEGPDKNFNRMIRVIDDIIIAINKHSENMDKFIKANGILRVLSTNLMTTHSQLRTKLLLLLKAIPDIATTTDSPIPLNIVDRLLDIFENDDNLALKAHALDILYKLLPNNPEAQVRVMKTKGLETFYNQMEKLDIGVIRTLMELFNKIVVEHLDARNDEAQAKDDGERLVTYQRIGLLEHLGTPVVCKGLLNILDTLWSYNNNENDNLKIILELLKNVKPFCSDTFMKKEQAIDLFKALLKYLKKEDKKEYFEENDINVTEYVAVIDDYLEKKKYERIREEF